MPIIITNDGPRWVPDTNCQNGISLGNRRTQKESLEQRQEGTIISTARALKYQRDGIMTEEEVNAGIETNAIAIKMEPVELRQLAQQYLQYQEYLQEINSKGIEKE